MAASNGTLVRGVLDGDRAAFAELYDRRAPLIRAICFDGTHDLEAAAEIAIREVQHRLEHREVYRSHGNSLREGLWRS